MDILNLLAKIDSGEVFEHHTSLCRGYVSVKSSGVVECYKGKFGTGYKLYTNNRKSSNYCL